MLEVQSLRYAAGPSFSALYDLRLAAGGRMALLGPSGGGKTTLLLLVAGLLSPESGRIRFGGRDLTDLSPADRPVSILFQDHNLFPHLSVADNVGLGLHPGLRLDAAARRRVAAALERVGLSGMAARMPGQLSGGQRQRVALARALARASRQRSLLLLDEPFSALDPALVDDMLDLVRGIVADHGLTMIMVTHTPAVAKAIADTAAVVENGCVRPVELSA